MITVSLTPQDAKLFTKFRQYQDDFAVLLKNGFFDFKDSWANVYRNKEGVLLNMKIIPMGRNIYRRGRKK